MIITGKITKFGSGVAFPNVNVRVVNSNPERSTQADAYGKYKITAYTGETLHFSHAGTQDTYDFTLTQYDVIVDAVLQDGYVMDDVYVTNKPKKSLWWLLLVIPAGYGAYKLIGSNNKKSTSVATKQPTKEVVKPNKKVKVQPKKVVM